MNIRNAKFVNPEETIVDVEIEHPQYGWIPYTFHYDSKDESFDEQIREYLQTATILKYIEPSKTAQEIKAEITNAIQSMLDDKAKAKGYDNIVSACSYAGYDNPFRAEGEAYGLWRALCWSKAYEILEAVETGIRPMPTISEVLEEMPALEIK